MDFLLEHPDQVSQLSHEEVIEVLSQTHRLLFCAILHEFTLRLQSSTSSMTTTADGDRLLDVQAASQLLSVTKQWLYRNGRNLNLVVELGAGTVRYSQAAILKFVKERVAKSHARKR